MVTRSCNVISLCHYAICYRLVFVVYLLHRVFFFERLVGRRAQLHICIMKIFKKETICWNICYHDFL